MEVLGTDVRTVPPPTYTPLHSCCLITPSLPPTSMASPPPTSQVPAGSHPRTIDVIMRHQAVESANPGDKACFTGMLVVVPDISAMTLPGNVSVKSEWTMWGRSEV